MLCEVCKKNDATVHLTEIINEKVTKLNLCEECAKQKGAEMEEHFGLGELLAGLTEFGETPAMKTPSKEPVVTIKCSGCALTYADFKRTGRLGCSECYSAFQSKLLPLLKRIHGADHHVGKIPAKAPRGVVVATKLQEFRLKMKKAVEAENFEEAARFRDEIKKIENKENKKK